MMDTGIVNKPGFVLGLPFHQLCPKVSSPHLSETQFVHHSEGSNDTFLATLQGWGEDKMNRCTQKAFVS